LAITYPRRSRSFILRENDAVLLFLPLFLLAAQAQDDFYLKNGDSITAQRLYTNFVESYVVTRFPKLNVRFVESGWPGDRVDGGLAGSIDQRLARDVVAIMLGMNDAGYRPFDATLFKAYSSGYEHIVKALKTALPNVRITAIVPSPYGRCHANAGFRRWLQCRAPTIVEHYTAALAFTAD
jgi:lysophospholipase L1-like esterase